MSTDQIRQFFAHISRDPSLRERVLKAVSADAAALIAQELGYEVSGDELLRFSGKSSSGVSVTKIQHPGNTTKRYGQRSYLSSPPKRMRTRIQDWNLPSS